MPCFSVQLPVLVVTIWDQIVAPNPQREAPPRGRFEVPKTVNDIASSNSSIPLPKAAPVFANLLAPLPPGAKPVRFGDMDLIAIAKARFRVVRCRDQVSLNGPDLS